MNNESMRAMHERWLEPDDDGPDPTCLVPELEAEFDTMEDAGCRSPGDFLTSRYSDEMVEIAYLMISGKRDEAMASLEMTIAKARERYVEKYICEFADEYAEKSHADQYD